MSCVMGYFRSFSECEPKIFVVLKRNWLQQTRNGWKKSEANWAPVNFCTSRHYSCISSQVEEPVGWRWLRSFDCMGSSKLLFILFALLFLFVGIFFPFFNWTELVNCINYHLISSLSKCHTDVLLDQNNEIPLPSINISLKYPSLNISLREGYFIDQNYAVFIKWLSV